MTACVGQRGQGTGELVRKVLGQDRRDRTTVGDIRDRTTVRDCRDRTTVADSHDRI
jgi:hypothetical protein